MDDDDATLDGSLSRGPTASMAVVEDPGPATGKRYELGRELGRGGMGEVLIAQDTRIAREVAIKLMRPEQRDPASIARFFREAQIQGRLEHPSVVPVHDLGVDVNGNPYFVMKRLAGTTLFEVLAERSRDPAVRTKWPRRQILARFVDVCLAIEFAHTRGVVHRDLKPANIMFGDFGEVYVLDWGLARVIGDDRSSGPITTPFPKSDPMQTSAGALLGTPGYMPPEQIRDAAVGRRADVYALGCILYEIMTGETALPSGMVALEVTLASECHRPSVRFPEVAIPELDDICAEATAAAADDRPTARALADAVQAYLDGDRDLARRRAMATTHATRARDALADIGDDARAIAIREAGRALVLDAGNEAAQTVLAHLLLETPNVLPRAAREAADRNRSIARQAMLRSIWRGYLVIALLTCGAFIWHVRYPIVIWTEVALLLGASATTYLAARRPLAMRSPQFVVIIAFNTAALACGCLILGPFLVMPVFLIGALTGSLIPPHGYRWWQVVGPQLLGFVVPLVLEWLDVLPATYRIDHGLVLTPWVIELGPTVTGPLILLATITPVVLTLAMMTTQRRMQAAAEDRVHAHTWHLQQLLPHGTTAKRRPATGERG